MSEAAVESNKPAVVTNSPPIERGGVSEAGVESNKPAVVINSPPIEGEG